MAIIFHLSNCKIYVLAQTHQARKFSGAGGYGGDFSVLQFAYVVFLVTLSEFDIRFHLLHKMNQEAIHIFPLLSTKKLYTV